MTVWAAGGAAAAIATAPVRVCDAGGWTDTWFAGHGAVCCLAVSPGATATARLEASGRAGGVIADLAVAAVGERYRFPVASPPGRHPLLEAALRRWAPGGGGLLSVTVDAGVPPGCGVGTSASVTVAMLGALQALAGIAIQPDEVASSAHLIETVDLGQQSGVQDQFAAAHGGALLISVEYPAATVAELSLSPDTWRELGRRLLTVYLGRPHRSSAVHEEVIAALSVDPARRERLEPLRQAAADAAAALAAGDLDGYGAALAANTDAQAGLHPALVSGLAQRVIELARRHRACGWKVNGAGGEGGSVSIIGPADPEPLRLALAAEPGLELLPLTPSRTGLAVSRPEESLERGDGVGFSG